MAIRCSQYKTLSTTVTVLRPVSLSVSAMLLASNVGRIDTMMPACIKGGYAALILWTASLSNCSVSLRLYSAFKKDAFSKQCF